MARSVFYSFHYKRDVARVQLVQKINALEGQPLLNPQRWETIKNRPKAEVEEWIDGEMKYKRAVIVLIGHDTASRPWVQYEVNRAWFLKKPLLGVRIHGLSAFGEADTAGPNPFSHLSGGPTVPVFDPTRSDWAGRIDTQATYAQVVQNLEDWSLRGVTRY